MIKDYNNEKIPAIRLAKELLAEQVECAFSNIYDIVKHSEMYDWTEKEESDFDRFLRKDLARLLTTLGFEEAGDYLIHNNN